MSGVGFLATMKTFAPSIRRRRRVDKQNLELHNNNNGGGGAGGGTDSGGVGATPHRSSSAATTPTAGPTAGDHRGGIAAGIMGVGEVISPSSWDIVPPITPPAAFLPPGYKRLSMKGKLGPWRDRGLCNGRVLLLRRAATHPPGELVVFAVWLLSDDGREIFGRLFVVGKVVKVRGLLRIVHKRECCRELQKLSQSTSWMEKCRTALV